jgi:hypothetical protein
MEELDFAGPYEVLTGPAVVLAVALASEALLYGLD